MSLLIFGLYFWFSFLSLEKPAYDISLVTLGLSIAAGAAGAIARLVSGLRGEFTRTLISYLLLAATVGFLLYDTYGLLSPYVFMWTLVASFAGLFGLFSSVPVFLIALASFALQFSNGQINSSNLVSTVLITVVPIIFSIIVWSHVRKISNYQTSRNPAAYKQQSSEMTSLVSGAEGLIDAIGDGVLAVDSQGVVQLINPAAEHILGWGEQDATNLNYLSVVKLSSEQGQELSPAQDPIKQAIASNQEVRSKTLQAETKSGKKIFVSVTASPLGQTGSGVIVVVRDITKERSEERQQAEFISTASHEMRTPVASIEGYLGLALNPATAQIDQKARDYITKAHESAKHLGRLFQDLLDVSKAEDGRLSNEPVLLDIIPYVGEVVEGLTPKATEKGLELTYKPILKTGEKGERNLSPVFYANLDKDHVRELVANLTENAIKYTPKGSVSVDVTGDDKHIVISIADSGIGIPKEDIPHLFQKFYRVDSSDTREIGGTGLGLYLCRRLAETMGGRIWAESIHGQGSTFFVELPRIDRQEADRLRAQQEQPNIAPEKPKPIEPPHPTAPAPTPAPPMPAPTPPPAEPVPPQPAAATSQLKTNRVNIPISQIEQNPAAYTRAGAVQAAANRQVDYQRARQNQP